MTEKEISSCKKCRVCTGCGRGAKGQAGLQVVSDFTVSGGDGRENSLPEVKSLPEVNSLPEKNSLPEVNSLPEKNSLPEENGTPPYALLPEADENAMVIAVDIGTTTIVMQLRRIKDGKVVDTFRAINPQRKYGMDVLSRIRAAEETMESGETCAAEDMRSMVRAVLQQGIKQFQDTQWKGAEGDADKAGSRTPGGREDIKGMVIAANTTMIHLLMGYPVNTLGKAPFVSEYLEEIQTEIARIPTVILPGISAFVGADILAGLYACETHFGKMNLAEGKEAETRQAAARPGKRENFLFLDLGTNGEIVFGTGDKMFATATAAGPAFEGRLDANVWGADAVHFLAKLYEEGLVDETGLLTDEYFETGVTIGSTVVTQADIRSLQLAKAAVSAGIRVLSEEFYPINRAEHPYESISEKLRDNQGDDLKDNLKVYLAGGFGYFLNPKDATTIGLLSEEMEEQCISVGNAALEGVFCYGRERFSAVPEIAKKAYEKAVAIKEKTEVINLANMPSFEKYYIEAMNLPPISKN